MDGYTAFILSAAERRRLLDLFPPRYPAVKADHVTHRYGVSGFSDLFVPVSVEITGVADDGNGLEALSVTVDGRAARPDGRFYHITWSLDPGKAVPDSFLSAEEREKGGTVYRPVHSNLLISGVMEKPQSPFFFRKLHPPVRIAASPVFVGAKKVDGGRDVRFLVRGTPGFPAP